jgi:hypothetical protein
VERINEKAILKRIDAASDDDLLLAREIAHDLTASMALAARPNAPGGNASEKRPIRPFASAAPLAKVVAFFNVIALPVESRSAAAAFREATRNFESLMSRGTQWLEDHPELPDEVRRRGLTDVVREFAHKSS